MIPSESSIGSNEDELYKRAKPSVAYKQAIESPVYRISELMFGSLLASYVLGFISLIAAHLANPNAYGFMGILLPNIQYASISIIFAYLTASFYLSYHAGILTMYHRPLARLGFDFALSLAQPVCFGFSMLFPVWLPILLGVILLAGRYRQDSEHKGLADSFFYRICEPSLAVGSNENTQTTPKFAPLWQKVFELTEDLKEPLQDELDKLEKELREDLPQEIKRARQTGDLRDNGAYMAALTHQNFVKARIERLRRIRLGEISLTEKENARKIFQQEFVKLLKKYSELSGWQPVSKLVLYSALSFIFVGAVILYLVAGELPSDWPLRNALHLPEHWLWVQVLVTVESLILVIGIVYYGQQILSDRANFLYIRKKLPIKTDGSEMIAEKQGSAQTEEMAPMQAEEETIRMDDQFKNLLEDIERLCGQ
jgi:Transcription elongation factor, N-terminal